jgi:hypothetical protein
MSRFEDNLWREVERKYGSELSEADGPLQRRSRLRVPVIAGTSLGLVGASAVAVIVLSAASSSPAFAVTHNPDGTVSVVIRRIEGIPGANQRLAQLGIRARAVRIADGCQVAPPPALARVTVATFVRTRDAVSVGGTDGKVLARIRPTQIPIGRTLVIPAVRNGALVRLVRGRAVRGAVPTCLPPAVLIRSGSGRAGGRIVACRAAILRHARPVAPSQGTNPTSTTAPPAPSTATGTTPAPGTTTEPGTTTGTGTTTGPGATANTGTSAGSTGTTGSAATTNAGTATSSSRVGPPNIKLPAPLVRACLAVRGGAR